MTLLRDFRFLLLLPALLIGLSCELQSGDSALCQGLTVQNCDVYANLKMKGDSLTGRMARRAVQYYADQLMQWRVMEPENEAYVAAFEKIQQLNEPFLRAEAELYQIRAMGGFSSPVGGELEALTRFVEANYPLVLQDSSLAYAVQLAKVGDFSLALNLVQATRQSCVELLMQGVGPPAYR